MRGGVSVTITGKTAEECVQDFKDSFGNEGITDVQSSPDGSVTVTFTESQRQAAVSHMEQRISDMNDLIKSKKDSYAAETNNDYTVLTVRYDRDLDMNTILMVVFGSETYCAYHQIFTENNGWKISINIYNSDTGKLLASGDQDHAISYDDSDWDRTEQ